MRCEVCNKQPAIDKHHMFSNTKVNQKYYGKGNPIDGIDWLNDPKNIMLLCRSCHDNSKDRKISEINFCRLMDITPRSKTGKIIWFKIGER